MEGNFTMRRKFFIRNFFVIALPVAFIVALLGCMAIYITYNSTKKSVLFAQEQMVDRIKESSDVIFSEADAQSLIIAFLPMLLLSCSPF